MASGGADAQKTADELLKEIEELRRQEREMTSRLFPRTFRRPGYGLGRGRAVVGGGAGGNRGRGVVRSAEEDPEDQPSAKRRIASLVVKKGEEINGNGDAVKNKAEVDARKEERLEVEDEGEIKENADGHGNGGLRRDGKSRMRKNDIDKELPEPTKRQPKLVDDGGLVRRNQRMFGQLLGTLTKFAEEDRKLSSTEAFMRRSDSLKRAEEKAREESERLRQQREEQNVEKRKRDMILRARIAVKAEQKTLDLLYLSWTEHHKNLSNFLRTKAEPPIYYMPAKPLADDPSGSAQQEQAFVEWKAARRAELSEYQRKIEEERMVNVDKELENWLNARSTRGRNNAANLQETMDKELETHNLEHGPKTRRIPGNNDDEEDVEDIAAEDELLDEVLEIQDGRIDGEMEKPSVTEGGN